MEQILYESVEGRPTLDPARLEVLRRLAILTDEGSAPLDRLTAAAKEALNVPVVLLTLVDEERQFFKCQVGLPEPWATKRETPFTHSFCRHVVDLSEPLVIEDAREHPVLKANLAIPDLNVIAYAGVPLVTTDGFALGTFSVIDHQPRKWTEREIEILQAFAAGVMASLELHSEKQMAVAVSKELEESRALLQQVTENVNDVLWLVDTSSGKIIYITRNVEQVWGIKAERLLNDAGIWRERVHPEDLARVDSRFASALAGQPESIEFRVIRGDGAQRWLKTRLYPIRDEGGHQYRLVGTTEDFTEKRDVEQQLLQAQKMQAVGQLAAGIAHDFNNLLAVVLGSAELLKGVVPDSGQGDLRTVEEATRRGAEIVAQLLSFSKKQSFAPTTLNLNDVLHEMEPLMRQTLRENVDLLLDLDSKLPSIEIDPGALDQVVVNLLVNAREAMPKGGTVAVKTGATEVDVLFGEMHGGIRPGSYVCLTISDTGVGMDDSVRVRAFEPYFSTKAPWESGGLGLSTVAGVVDRSGGTISLYSEPGVGTTVKVFFPMTTAPEAPDVVTPPTPKQGAGERLLVVEDNELMVKILMRMLESSNYVPVAARSGKEALDRVDASEPFAAVLTDVVMPGMSGRDLLGHLRSVGFKGEVIFMSGYTSEILDRHGVLPEEVHYLQKPFTRAEVLTVLTSALGKR